MTIETSVLPAETQAEKWAARGIEAVWQIFSIALNGFTVMMLWNWFLPLIFVEIPTLSFGYAVGIALFIGYATATRPHVKEREIEAISRSIAFTLSACIFYLVAGYFVHELIT